MTAFARGFVRLCSQTGSRHAPQCWVGCARASTQLVPCDAVGRVSSGKRWRTWQPWRDKWMCYIRHESRRQVWYCEAVRVSTTLCITWQLDAFTSAALIQLLQSGT